MAHPRPAESDSGGGAWRCFYTPSSTGLEPEGPSIIQLYLVTKGTNNTTLSGKLVQIQELAFLTNQVTKAPPAWLS